MLLTLIFGVVLIYAGLYIFLHKFFYHHNSYDRDINNKVILVTGGTAGIGRVVVKELISRGAIVIFTGRKSQNAREIINSLITDPTISKSLADKCINGKWDSSQNYHSEKLYYYRLDQSDLSEVSKFGAWVKENFEKIDTLLNNAGTLVYSHKLDRNGYELTQVINHLSHFLLTHDLLPLLDDEGSRVVNVSSIVHLRTFMPKVNVQIDLKDFFNEKQKKYNQGEQYAQSKMANVLFAQKLNDFFKDKNKNAKSVSLHPGIIDSNFLDKCNIEIVKKLYVLTGAKFLCMNVKEGAQTSLTTVLCGLPHLAGGKYYASGKLAKRDECAEDKEYVNGFWKASKELVEKAVNRKLENFDL